MPDHIKNRAGIVVALAEELIGPAPRGREIDCSGDVSFSTIPESYGPFKQAGSGEEILQRDTPTKRYGIGVLYPQGLSSDDEQKQDSVEQLDEPHGDEFSAISVNEDVDGDRRSEAIAEIASRSSGIDSHVDGDEDIEDSNANL